MTCETMSQSDAALARAMESPCIGVCEIDLVSGFCRGCGRKTKEIAAWSVLNAQQRAEIIAQLPGRLPLTRRRQGGRRGRQRSSSA